MLAEQRRIGDVVCSPTRVYLSRMQLPAWSLERSLRCGLGSELPSWLQGDCRDLHPEGIFLPSPASPRRRTCLEWISRSGEHQQSSKAQGARGSPDPLWPMETQWLGVEKGQRCFAEQRCICTAVCSPRRVDVSRMQLSEPRLGRGCDGASVLRCLAGSGGIAGAYAQKAFSSQLLLVHEGEHVWSGFPAQ